MVIKNYIKLNNMISKQEKKIRKNLIKINNLKQ